MNNSDLIQSHHLSRLAMIYIRQSSPHQVINNQESLRLQYALKQRALDLGWSEHEVCIIDADLGRTARTTTGRSGFQELVARIALGKVGIIIAYDATRLARNCSHWYQLLDLCGHIQCLIADYDGVYNPASINGRLLLGLKGQISELELHTIRARLTAGLLNKAERGELALTLPTGLVRLSTGKVVKSPDREVESRIHLVFETMLKQKAITKVVRFFLKHNLKLPRQDGFGQIKWKRPTVASIGAILKNPAYAGAFVYGRTRTCNSAGKKQQKLLPPSQWKICIPDKYPAYISWDKFEKIQAMIQDNYSEYDRNKSRGVPREGKALLHGLVYCGQCGHKMVVQYKGGTRYICNYLRQQFGEPVCQYLPADSIDKQVVKWFFEALSVAEIDVSVNALVEADRQYSQVLAAHRQEVERLRYQVRLAERQYQSADPENRLVTAELEKRWEQVLREQKDSEERLQKQQQQTPHWAIPAELLKALKDLGPRLPEMWEQNLFTSRQKKALLRTLIDKVVVHRVGGDHVRIRVVWRGGETTSSDVPVPVGSLAQLSGKKEMEAFIVAQACEGQEDQAIARELTSRGYRSPLNTVVLPSTVKTIRLRQGIMAQRHQSHPRRIPNRLTVSQIAAQLNIPPHWIYGRIHNGTIQVSKDAKTRLFLFPDKPNTIEQFRQLQTGLFKNLRY